MKNTVYFAIIIFLLLVVIVIHFLFPVGFMNASSVHPEKIRQYAAKLEAEELFPQAIDAYKEYLAVASLPDELHANILYRMGTLYLENLQDYENALAAFIKISDLYPKTKIAIEADKRKMPCYEGLRRGFDAQRKLNQLTALHPDAQAGTGPVVAEIGDRKIYLDQIEREISLLPEYARSQYETPQGKLDFLRTRIFQDLLYDMAIRKEYDKDTGVRKQMQDFQKNLLAQKIYKEEVQDIIEVTASDIELYYKANPGDFTTPASAQIAHIQVDSLEKANDVRQQILEGLSFSDAVTQFSTNDASKSKEGQIGSINSQSKFISGIGNAPEIVTLLLGLETEALSEPQSIGDHYHIFKILEKTPKHVKPLDEVKQQVQMMVRRMKETEKREDLTQHLLSSEKVKIYSQVFQTNDNAPSTEEE